MSESEALRRRFSKKAYAKFISELDVEHVWMEGLSFSNIAGPVKPADVSVNLMVQGRWEPFEGGFLGQSMFEVDIFEADDMEFEEFPISLTATFNAKFAVDSLPADPILDEFTREYLQTFTWPYFRLLLADLMSRTGWSEFTLPPTITRF
jgi:hypothetical protein